MRDEVAVRDRIFQSVNFERSFVCQARSLVRLLFGGPATGWFGWQAARLSVLYLLASALPNINAMKLFDYASSFQIGLPANSTKRSLAKSVLAPGGTRAALSSARRRIDSSLITHQAAAPIPLRLGGDGRVA